MACSAPPDARLAETRQKAQASMDGGKVSASSSDWRGSNAGISLATLFPALRSASMMAGRDGRGTNQSPINRRRLGAAANVDQKLDHAIG